MERPRAPVGARVGDGVVATVGIQVGTPMGACNESMSQSIGALLIGIAGIYFWSTLNDDKVGYSLPQIMICVVLRIT